MRKNEIGEFQDVLQVKCKSVSFSACLLFHKRPLLTRGRSVGFGTEISLKNNDCL